VKLLLVYRFLVVLVVRPCKTSPARLKCQGCIVQYLEAAQSRQISTLVQVVTEKDSRHARATKVLKREKRRQRLNRQDMLGDKVGSHLMNRSLSKS